MFRLLLLSQFFLTNAHGQLGGAIYNKKGLPPELNGERENLNDTVDNCEELVALGKCYSDRENTWNICKKSCSEAQDLDRKTDGEVEYFPISVDDESFFDLTALTSTGELYHFESFMGKFTIVLNFSVICWPENTTRRKVEGDAYFKNVENIHALWPEGLEIIIFQYNHPKFNYEEDDCSSYIEASKKPGRPIHVMEVIDMHGSFEDRHPVYQYLQSRTGNHRMNYEQPAYFIISPDGHQIEYHRHTNFAALKQYITKELISDNEL